MRVMCCIISKLACGVLTGKFKYTDLEDKNNKKDGRFFVENEWTEV